MQPLNRLRGVFLFIILLTLPFYCLGGILLAVPLPRPGGPAPAVTDTPPLPAPPTASPP